MAIFVAQREKGETERRVDGDAGGAKWESWRRNSAALELGLQRLVDIIDYVNSVNLSTQ